MQEKTQYVHNNPYTRPGIKNSGVRSVVWHYTASPGASAQNIRDYFDGTCVRSKRYASAHDTIDNIEVIHMIPHDEEAYHAHDHNRCLVPKLAPNANLTSIGVELCIDQHGNLEKATYDNAVEYGAELCRKYGMDPLKDFYRHYDVTHKNCPAFWVSNPAGFEQFKKDVADKLHPKKELDIMEKFEELFEQELDKLREKSVSNWAQKDWEESEKNGYFDGTGPQGLITRQEVAIVVNRIRDNFKPLFVEIDNRLKKLEGVDK